jgi:hypothetical protein
MMRPGENSGTPSVPQLRPSTSKTRMEEARDSLAVAIKEFQKLTDREPTLEEEVEDLVMTAILALLSATGVVAMSIS